MSPQHAAQLLQSKAATIATLLHRLAWFERQLFGKKSERFAPEPDPDPQQKHFGQLPGELAAPVEQAQVASTVPALILANTGLKSRSDFADTAGQVPFFDEAVVPVQTIEVPNTEAQALRPNGTRSSATRSATVWRSARAASSCSSTCELASSMGHAKFNQVMRLSAPSRGALARKPNCS
jgi:Transposase C of IS166 homeodomain